MQPSQLAWYLRRFRRMSAQEVAWRLSDQARKRAWARQQVRPGRPAVAAELHTHARPNRRFSATLPATALTGIPDAERALVVATADEILGGRWAVLGAVRADMRDPDWFLDPVTGRRAPQHACCFGIDHRDPHVTGNVKQVWELSRLHHVTVLGAAFAVSGDERYAETAARHLRSWWAENPFLSGVHWTSGIEIGIRLISWVWIRRLLDGWPRAATLFEDNDAALSQIWWHQRYLEGFRSRGSSANNHVIAEAAGQLVAALAFDWFDESGRWAAEAAELLVEELQRNTFESGVNREMAFSYHGFVAELGLVAAAEAAAAGRPLPDRTWEIVGRMLDVVASVVDVRLRAPRQGDSDDGRALVLGPPGANRWESLLALGGAIFGAAAWWPPAEPDMASSLVASMAGAHPLDRRSPRRLDHFADAGLTLLRSDPDDGPELWCRCDGGPHGFLSIAAHAHADALSVEVRHAGTEVLADPGTYCYGTEPVWRGYFRSTIGHNTVELAGQDQSLSGGPTLWMRHAHATVLQVERDAAERVTGWSAEHDGYQALEPPAVHRRTVRLSSRERRIEIVDQVDTSGIHKIRLAFHLGPHVDAELEGGSVRLSWNGEGSGATLELPDGLCWTLARGSTDPLLGWYSSDFGDKAPATTVLGAGICKRGLEFRTVLQFGGNTP